jgi:hypothetical protein
MSKFFCRNVIYTERFFDSSSKPQKKSEAFLLWFASSHSVEIPSFKTYVSSEYSPNIFRLLLPLNHQNSQKTPKRKQSK